MEGAHHERTAEGAKPRAPSRQGLVEYLLVTGFLLVAASGAVAVFGDELRDAFGVAHPAAPSALRLSSPPASAPPASL